MSGKLRQRIPEEVLAELTLKVQEAAHQTDRKARAFQEKKTAGAKF